MKNFEEKLDAYAKLVVEVGANVQSGEPVLISCPVDAANFARLLAKHSYFRGASEVVVNWADDYLSLLKYENQSIDVLSHIPDFKYDEMKYYYEKGANLIKVYAEDPELLKDIEIEKLNQASKARAQKFKSLQKYTMNDIISWTIVSVPTKAWAEKIFPNLKGKKAIDELWNKIFEVTRMNEENPLLSWSKHIKNLEEKADYLNQHQFEKLHYKSSNGTDLVIGLPKNHIWMSAGSKNSKGSYFVPNIPTEEVFTLPHKDKVDGIVYSTKALAVNGKVVENFWLKFENGKVVDFDAESGKDSLKSIFDQDENARSLGEVALVPYDSPISKSNLMFFNTLFDENASCHLAFGQAYPTTIEGGTEMTKEELEANGVNDSLLHHDFMIGSKDLNITAYLSDGREVQIFKNGNWAI